MDLFTSDEARIWGVGAAAPHPSPFESGLAPSTRPNTPTKAIPHKESIFKELE